MKEQLDTKTGILNLQEPVGEKEQQRVRGSSGHQDMEVPDEVVQVAARLRFALAPHERIIAFTDAKPADGSAIVASRVGLALARMSEGPVLVIDGRLPAAGAAAVQRVAATPGLAEAIAGTVELTGAIAQSQVSNFFLMPWGNVRVTEAVALAASPRAKDIFAILQEHFRYVCIDVGSILNSPLGLLLSSYSNGVVLSLAAGISRREETDRVRRELKASGLKLLGVVLTCQK